MGGGLKGLLPVAALGATAAAPFLFPTLGAAAGLGAAGGAGLGAAGGAGAAGAAGSSLGLAGLPSAVTSFGAPLAAGASGAVPFAMGGGMGSLLAGVPAAGGMGSLGLAGLTGPAAGAGLTGFQNPGMLAQLGSALGKMDLSKLGQIPGLAGQQQGEQQQQMPPPMGPPLPVGGEGMAQGPGILDAATQFSAQPPGQQGQLTPEMLMLMDALSRQGGGAGGGTGMSTTQHITNQPLY